MTNKITKEQIEYISTAPTEVESYRRYKVVMKPLDIEIDGIMASPSFTKNQRRSAFNKYKKNREDAFNAWWNWMSAARKHNPGFTNDENARIRKSSKEVKGGLSKREQHNLAKLEEKDLREAKRAQSDKEFFESMEERRANKKVNQ